MKKAKKRIVLNIVFYSLIVIMYAFAIASVIVRANGVVLYLFNNRFDIVLSNSMSYRNEMYKDFLEGTSQFQKDDLLVSSRVDDSTELQLKDVVLFKSEEYEGKLIAHRIVNIIEQGTLFTLNGVEQTEINSSKCIKIKSIDSLITLASSPVTRVEFQYYTKNDYQLLFEMKIGNITYSPFHETQQVGEYYLHNCYFQNSNPEIANVYLYINENTIPYITNVKYVLDSEKEFNFSGDELITTTDYFQKRFDYELLYETRGDIASISEKDLLKREAVISRVHTIIPKLGGFVRFITSIYGIVLLIGIGIILTVNSYIVDKLLSSDKKAKMVTEQNIEKPTEENDESKTKDIDK